MPESTTELVTFRSPTARMWMVVMGSLVLRPGSVAASVVAAVVAAVSLMEDTGVVLSPEASLKIATPQPTRTTSAQAVNRSILLRRRCCILLAASRFFRRLSISSRSSATAVTPFVSCFCYYNGFSGIKQVSNFEFFFKSAIFPPNLPPRGRGTAAAVEEGSHGRERFVACALF